MEGHECSLVVEVYVVAGEYGAGTAVSSLVGEGDGKVVSAVSGS